MMIARPKTIALAIEAAERAVAPTDDAKGWSAQQRRIIAELKRLRDGGKLSVPKVVG